MCEKQDRPFDVSKAKERISRALKSKARVSRVYFNGPKGTYVRNRGKAGFYRLGPAFTRNVPFRVDALRRIYVFPAKVFALDLPYRDSE